MGSMAMAGATTRICTPPASPVFRTRAVSARFVTRSPRPFQRLQATSQDSSNQPSTSASSIEQQKPAEEPEHQEQEQEQDNGQALKELRQRRDEAKPSLVEGLVEEIGLIEWPSLRKVVGTTLVVMGIITGSSVVLLTVNFVLAQLSDAIFKTQ